MQKQTARLLSIPSLLESTTSLYQDLLGYKPGQTALQQVPEIQWQEFTRIRGLNTNSQGMFLPRNQTAIIRGNSPLSLFHEYLGHGLYCEQSLTGRKLVKLERKLLLEEEREFHDKQFTLDDLRTFRQMNQTFLELDGFRRANLGVYESFAVWVEYFLSREFGFMDDFRRKYELIPEDTKKILNRLTILNQRHGDLAIFYEFGLARITTKDRVKRLLQEMYGPDSVNHSKLILLTGSKRPFSDIDLFASSNTMFPIKNDWLDLVIFDEDDFERRVKLFEVQVTHPIMVGELVAGEFRYLQQKRKQLQEQPITEEAIQYNFGLSIEQRKLAMRYPENSKEREIGLSYSRSYLANALALQKGKRLLIKEHLDSYNEIPIDLKGGKK